MKRILFVTMTVFGAFALSAVETAKMSLAEIGRAHV